MLRVDPRVPALTLSVVALGCMPAGAQIDTLKTNSLQRAMLFRSFIQDAPECSVSLESGAPVFAGGVDSPAATCPDAFAWVQFASSIRDTFWDWGIDQTVWPEDPWPICRSGQTERCCDRTAPINPDGPPPEHCPYYRADYTVPSPLPATTSRPSGAVINHRGETTVERLDPGRLLRDLELELVFRNKRMVQYIYEQDLYNTQGLAARNRAQNSALRGGDLDRAQRLQVRFPTDAVMVKADFVHQNVMLAQGLIDTVTADRQRLDPPQNPDYPYLTVYIDGTHTDTTETPGLYYLVALTNASKALPVWHWYAMEHVANRGRCDYTGCNDSFGYAADPMAQPGADFGSHFIPPVIVRNNDVEVPSTEARDPNSPIFKTGEVYDPARTGERRTAQLQTLLERLGVGIEPSDPDYRRISVDDPAWNNYRLKGTQTTFTTATGVPTGTGATVTEGGFVNSSSCATCHAQAAVDANGNPASQGVGSTWRPNLFGYSQVVMGTPDMAWFYAGSGQTEVRTTQIDFVWGILQASCIKAANGSDCAPIPDAPRSPPR